MAGKYNVVDAAKDFVAGKLETVPATIAQQRIDICKTCDAQNKLLHICTVCGCAIPLKVKLAKSSCPMELWGEYDSKIQS